MVLAPGWRPRAGKLDATEEMEALSDPAVVHVGAAWLIRYPVAAWAPGSRTVTLPPIWRLGPDGRVDSIAGGSVTFSVASVLPDTGAPPEPRGMLAPLRSRRHDPRPPLAALVVSGALLAAGVALRRRPPRAVGPARRVRLEGEVPDARWLAAGEPKAVAARAAWRLRAAIARVVPEAHPALSTAECLAAVERARPALAGRELRDMLEHLDRIAFASAHGTDVAALAAMARRLAQDLSR